MTNLGKCYLYRFYAFLAYSVPMIALLIINREEYIQDKGARMGLYGFVVLALVVIAFKNTILSAVKKNPLLTVSIILLIFSVLMKSISTSMITICAVSIIGSLLMMFVDVVGDVYRDRAYIIKDGIRMKNKQRAMTDREAWKEAYGFGGVK